MQCDWIKFTKKSDFLFCILQGHMLCAMQDLTAFHTVILLRNLLVFWEERKKIVFNNKMLEGQKLVNELEYNPEYKYVIYGTGTYGQKAYEGITRIGGKVAFFCDSNKENRKSRCLIFQCMLLIK